MIVLQAMFSRGLGGLERAFLDHAAMLAARGHEVHCVVAQSAASRTELERFAGTVAGRNIHLHRVATQGLHRLLLRLRLRRLVRRVAPDVLVAHGAKAVTRLVGLRPRAVPLVGITHNASPRLRHATHLIALTGSLQRHFAERGFPEARIARAPNTIPTHLVAQPRIPGAAHEPPVVGVLARLVHKKGVDIFLEGFRRALDRGLRAEAVIGGDGPERATLEALCRRLGLERDVRFIGWVEDTAAFYRSIDVFCVPSREEPFGTVLLEGFAYGAPVLASAVGGPAEVIEHDRNGRLFACGDVDALAGELTAMVQDPALRDRLRAAGYAALPRYRPEVVGAQIDAALRAAIDDLA